MQSYLIIEGCPQNPAVEKPEATVGSGGFGNPLDAVVMCFMPLILSL